MSSPMGSAQTAQNAIWPRWRGGPLVVNTGSVGSLDTHPQIHEAGFLLGPLQSQPNKGIPASLKSYWGKPPTICGLSIRSPTSLHR